MKSKIKISKNGTAYFSDELRDEGFIDEIEILSNASVAVLLKSGVSMVAIKEGLRIILENIQLQKSLEENY